MAAVGFVGLGAMGSRMARRLLDAGHELTVWNRHSDKAEPLASAGAAVATSPAEAARAIGVLGEALSLAAGLGLPRDTAFDVLGTTALAGQAERRRAAFESGEYPPRFPVALARKDADLILEAAEAAGLDVRVAAAARAWLVEAEERGRGEQDYSAVLDEIVRTPWR